MDLETFLTRWKQDLRFPRRLLFPDGARVLASTQIYRSKFIINQYIFINHKTLGGRDLAPSPVTGRGRYFCWIFIIGFNANSSVFIYNLIKSQVDHWPLCLVLSMPAPLRLQKICKLKTPMHDHFLFYCRNFLWTSCSNWVLKVKRFL